MSRRLSLLMAAYVVVASGASALLGLAGKAGSAAILGMAPLVTVLLASTKHSLAYLAPAALLACVWAASLAGLSLGG